MGYALLGACWLIWKTDGPLQALARFFARIGTPALLFAIGAVSLATPFIERQYFERWFDYPACSSLCRCRCWSRERPSALWRSIERTRDWLPFALTLSLFC